MGINEKYIRWIYVLFGNATAAVNLNGNPSESFNIERGVRQDYWVNYWVPRLD